MGGGIALCTWSGLRRARARLLLLALVLGVLGGTSLAAFAGARRTSSVLDRLAAATDEPDAIVVDSDPAGVPFFDRARLRGARGVDRLATEVLFDVFSGASDAGPFPDYVLVFAPGDEAGERLLSHRLLLHGRHPAPDRADEATVNETMADEIGVEVGDDISVCLPTDAQIDAFNRGGGAPSCDQRALLRVVGIDVTVGDFAPRQADSGLGRITTSRAFTDRWIRRVHDTFIFDFWLSEGDSARSAFLDDVQQAAGGLPADVVFLADDLGRARSAMRPLAVSLGLLGALAALASVLVGGQALARTVRVTAGDDEILRALGLTRRQRIAASSARVSPTVVGGAVLAVTIAIALSWFLPLGLARDAEPDRGFHVDALVAFAGAAALSAVLVVLAVATAWATTTRTRVPRTSAATRLLGRLSLRSASADTGVRLALEPTAGAARVPVRSTLLYGIVGVGVVVAALVVGADVHHLFDTPRLYGYGWDTMLGDGFGPPFPDEMVDAFARDRTFASVAAGGLGRVNVDGRDTSVLGIDSVAGRVDVSVIDGRTPTGAGEIALGSDTLADLDVAIGDTVRVTTPGSGERLELVVVGRIALPQVNLIDGVSDGAAMRFETLQRLVPETARNIVFVDLQHDMTPDELARHLGEALRPFADAIGIPEEALDDIPAEELAPFRPTDLVDLARIDQMPTILALGAGTVAVAMLGHLLVSSVRLRRRDLALLEVFGFTRRQVLATVGWQASTLAAISLVIGLPLGVALGHSLWRAYVREVGLVPEVVTPLTTLGLAVAVALVIANVVAAATGWLAARARPATVLRTE